MSGFVYLLFIQIRHKKCPSIKIFFAEVVLGPFCLLLHKMSFGMLKIFVFDLVIMSEFLYFISVSFVVYNFFGTPRATCWLDCGLLAIVASLRPSVNGLNDLVFIFIYYYMN